jgi:hypothetical protein
MEATPLLPTLKLLNRQFVRAPLAVNPQSIEPASGIVDRDDQVRFASADPGPSEFDNLVGHDLVGQEGSRAGGVYEFGNLTQVSSV